MVSCSAQERPDLFPAARVGLGAFGVLTEVTLQCVPAFLLAADEHPEPLEAVLDGFDETHRHARTTVEFYWFPHTDTALVKSNTPAAAATACRTGCRAGGLCVDDELLANGVFAADLRGRSAGAAASSRRSIGRRGELVSVRTSPTSRTRVFTSPRRVRFREMEYALAAGRAAAARCARSRR